MIIARIGDMLAVAALAGTMRRKGGADPSCRSNAQETTAAFAFLAIFVF